MARAIWNGAVIAESDRGEIIENNYYFPPDSAKNITGYVAFWKGVSVER